MHDVATRAIRANRATQTVEAFAIEPNQFGRHRDFGFHARFSVDKQEIAVDTAFARGIDDLRREHLQREEIKPAPRDHAEPLLKSLRKEEVREHNHHAAALPCSTDKAHRFFKA